MDTDDLSKETTEGVLTTATKLHEDLTLHFGLLAEDCENDDEYLQAAQELITEFLSFDEDELFDVFFEHPPSMLLFQKTLKQIQANIQQISMIPMDKRTFEFNP